MKTIETTWGKIFENDHLVLFNEFPNILRDLERYEEAYEWFPAEDDREEAWEVFQWYIVPNDNTVEWLEKYCPEIAEDIHYSETIGHYILAVYHYGTGWDAVRATLEVDDSTEDGKRLADFYQKTYHDDLPDWVKRNVFLEGDK